ncbi:ATP-binding cassette sub-family B member 6-like [Haliotis cracherodii]|uniref:ATP-binding cassette sub-family B member 6-like n=1 Tax=Haliotis cracherodii TaxID=6455 RepID=UPI0039EC4E5D
MLLCENNTLWTSIWVDEGINQCFFDSMSAGVLFVIIVICGFTQCFFYGRYATLIQPRRIPWSGWYIVQIIITVLMASETLLHMIVQDTSLGQQLYGYEILTAMLLLVAWIISLRLMSLERNYALPSIPTRGHGLVLLLFWCLAFVRENLAFVSWWSHKWWWYMDSVENHLEFGFWVVRYVFTLALFIMGLKAPGLSHMKYDILVNDMSGGGVGGQSTSTWSNIMQKLRMMIPYCWPKGNVLLQLTVLMCLIILAAGRVINVFVPIYSKLIINSLTPSKETSGDDLTAPTLSFRWDYILVSVGLSFLRGGGAGTSGLLNNIRSFLWIKVQQFTTRRVQVKLFNHLHQLSLRWHLQRKTGEVLRVVDRGTNSINSLLSYLLFNIVPTIADIVIAIVYFITAFNYIFGVIVFLCMALYLTYTILITEWRTKYRRLTNKLDNEANGKAVDSLLNFETVKYYGASDFETGRYDTAIKAFQSAEWKSTASLNLLNLGQNFIVNIGTLTGSLLCAYAVVHGLSSLQLTVGDYVLFGTYIAQLYAPLNWLGTYYRMIQQAFIDMENMFELLDEDCEVTDTPGAPDLVLKEGQIEFRDVSFHYDPAKQILKNISFTVPPGQTFALVGHTGSGKSTVIRLLFRFYDVNKGTVLIDGQDISQVTQKSLRKHIGVVPQDTVLFNNDIRYNIRYGKVDAADNDVYEAAAFADIHHRILGFPSGYETVVGERGLKLSGGEKQRVAIARTMLKAPAIVLLDEATSALDTKTERNIQASLARVSENKTTLVVAHRLSTVINANQILVLDEGEIIERGTHDELLESEGAYYEMWQQQLTKTEEGDENGDENGASNGGDGNGDDKS